MATNARVTFVMLGDDELEIAVEWESMRETMHYDVDSLQATMVRNAAQEVVGSHLKHLLQDGYIIGEPPPGANQDEQPPL